MTQLRWAARRHAIYGSISLASIFDNCPPANRRYAPLRGQQQLAWALAGLDQADPSFAFFVC